MKKLLIAFLLIFPVSFASATHNMAGDISYTHISGYTYKITVRTFTNTSGTSADRCELIMYLGNSDSVIVPRTNGPSIICPATHDGVMISACASGVKYNIYETMYSFAAPGAYFISVEDPNRSAGICNIPNSVNVSFFLQAELVINPFLGSNNAQPEVSVYPNPSFDNVNFKISNLISSEEYNIVIYNSLGQHIKNISTNNNLLSVTGLSPGMYFYSLNTVNEILKQGKFIILEGSLK